MEALKAKYISDSPHAAFNTPHTNVVWGEGNTQAWLMFVGEAPGEEEDRTGRPFVGKAGQLLEKMIVAMKLSRQEVYIANVLKVRPPNNATPTSAECAASMPYLIEQIAIVSPLVIVTLGLPATRTLLGTDASMGSLRGKWAAMALPDERQVKVMPTYHPAYVLRSYTEEVRAKVWSDLQMALSCKPD
jgi:DNA polymerase